MSRYAVLMRRLIAIALSLLCIALPLRSLADTVASGEHCPRMQAHMAADGQENVHTDMHADVDGLARTAANAPGGHDCCNDAATFAKTGQLCKMGQECSPPMTYLLPPTVLLAVIATQHAEAPALFTPFHSRPPAAVWRPPSLS
jgi:hypothetical protein